MRAVKLFNQQCMLVDDADSLGLPVNGLFEPAETRSLLGLARPGDRILDVGANIGYYSVLLAERVGAGGQVIAVEPSAQNVAVLDANTRAWQHEGRVRLFRAALSDRRGRARLYLSTHNAGMHRLYGSVVCGDAVEDIDTLCGDDLDLAPLDPGRSRSGANPLPGWQVVVGSGHCSLRGVSCRSSVHCERDA